MRSAECGVGELKNTERRTPNFDLKKRPLKKKKAREETSQAFFEFIL
jgi:hypothetical protein